MNEETNRLRVTYGKYDITLNPNMVGKMKIYQVEELKKVYIEMFKVFEQMENTSSPIRLYCLNKSIEPLEFKMQELFGFKVDSNYHRYWCECPKCTCPKIDNREMRGTGMRYYDSGCIIHGEKTLQLVQRKDKLEKLNNLDNETNL